MQVVRPVDSVNMNDMIGSTKTCIHSGPVSGIWGIRKSGEGSGQVGVMMRGGGGGNEAAAASGGSDKFSLLGLVMQRDASGLQVRRVDEGSKASESYFPFAYGDTIVSIDGAEVNGGDVEGMVEAANAAGSAIVGVLKKGTGAGEVGQEAGTEGSGEEVISVAVGGAAKVGGVMGGGGGTQTAGKSWRSLLQEEEWVVGDVGDDEEEWEGDEGDEGGQEFVGEEEEGDRNGDGNEVRSHDEGHGMPGGQLGAASQRECLGREGRSDKRGDGLLVAAAAAAKEEHGRNEAPVEVVRVLTHEALRRILLAVLTRERGAEAHLAGYSPLHHVQSPEHHQHPSPKIPENQSPKLH